MAKDDRDRLDERLTRRRSGLGERTIAQLLGVFDTSPGLERIWIFGSRARGDARPESDIDLVVDAPEWTLADHARLTGRIEALQLLYGVDTAWWQDKLDGTFRTRIERDRRVFWEPRRQSADVEAIGATELKPFQSVVLASVARYVEELLKHAVQAQRNAAALRVMEDIDPQLIRDASDFPRKAWAGLKNAGALPGQFVDQPYSSRFDGADRPIPNVCLKVPTGGGKTLLAAASVAHVFSSYLKRHTGLVLWVVPNEAIYRQTLKALSNRDHPYRQILNVAGAGRVKILEKNSPLTRLDTDSHLCVMVLMLASAARQSKETLRFFRDRGNVLGFLPREDDIEAHWTLLQQVPNLDVYAPFGADEEGARRQKGSIVKTSLGNVMRLLRPMVVMDEGHHAYTENALRTLDGFNPCFLLELSATPRVASARASGSNILVDVRGTDLDAAEMIKLPIHVEVKRWNDWQSCLAASVQQLDRLQAQAELLHAETARYLRPILLVQVERTGADLRDSGFIHAEDAKDYLKQLGFSDRQIAIKTSDKDELKQPENIDLLSPICEVRAIITKQALQEGWDCPFAYVLCALAAGRNPAAMTQLVGRILRQPQVAKTGNVDLDSCYVLCHDARTADVVNGIKKSLESEGMGDLTLSVKGDDAGSTRIKKIKLARRPAFAALRLFVPRVTWVESDGLRRELQYDSDILAHLPWQDFNADSLARDWAPDARGSLSAHVTIGLEILGPHAVSPQDKQAFLDATLNRAQLVRALLDLTPNAWLVWGWLECTLKRLTDLGYEETVLAGSSSSLIEKLRVDIEHERDRLAQKVFERLVSEGRIAFSLRADATDYELPHGLEMELASLPQPLQRNDAKAVEKSLLEPALRSADMNAFEAAFATYLDEKSALRWWHRNVAKTQYGLQGWKRNKVYPDFVFCYVVQGDKSRTVLMETKGLHLAGSQDTEYKQALLARLSEAFRDERTLRAGELVLSGTDKTELVCDLIFDQAWRGTLDNRHFSATPPQKD